jgi:aspartate/tyrosine/aromatic aminotransferase
MSKSISSALIHAAQHRAGDDPIFTLNANAAERAAAGESILNATLGALMDDEGKLVVMSSVSEVMHRSPDHPRFCRRRLRTSSATVR